MIARFFYQEDIATFLAEESISIFGKIVDEDEMTSIDTQKKRVEARDCYHERCAPTIPKTEKVAIE